MDRGQLPAAEFVGRAAEREALERAYARRGVAFVPVYGRRRVGKSELILQFLRGKPGIYHVGKVAPAALQIREFLREAARGLGEPLLADVPADDWAVALDRVVERWRGPGKLVLVLDEFQWTAGASPELPSILQQRLDRGWQVGGSGGGNVMLVLCGSFIGFMEREVLGQRSPLFGRRTAQIHLRPLDFRSAARLHPAWSITDRARLYFVCGGVPMYLRAFDGRRSFEANLAEQLLSEYSPLHREPEFLLREELRDVQSYHAVLGAIAAGRNSMRDIAEAGGLAERSLHYYLDQLVQLGYVARRHPLTGGRAPARNVRFVLEDPLLRFWFRFVFPNQSHLQRLGPRLGFAQVVRPELDSYFGGCFERLCREALPLLYAREGVTAAFQVGEYWDKSVQIDLVGVREDGWTDLGECKWGRVGSVKALALELEAKVRIYPNRRAATIGRRVFTRLPLPRHAEMPGLMCHDLASLYDAE